MKLLSAAQMKQLDLRAIEEGGVPGVVLMENAGRAVADLVCRRFSALRPGTVLVVAGKGNNGGDGYVVARHLVNRGWRVRVLVLAAMEDIGGDARTNLEILLRCGADLEFVSEEECLCQYLKMQGDAILLVDALFGTGLKSAVQGLCQRMIDWINASGLPVVAVDIPSGIDATTGQVLGTSVNAALTVTFAYPKLGHLLYPGARFVGALEVADIGIPAVLCRQLPDESLLVDALEAQSLLPERAVTGHKGSFGHLLVIAGSTGKSGAAAMASSGALRIGAGLVTLACPAGIHAVLEAKLTEAMTVPLPEFAGQVSLQAMPVVEQLWSEKRAVAIGPGLGQGEEVFALVRRLVRECPLPLVLDADGINALAGHVEILGERLGHVTVLTPHPGEMARITGLTVAAIETDRVGVARSFAVEHNVILVLKGAHTVTAFPDGRVRINKSGNPGMASGGMGDVLTGIIGGLLAQGIPATDAATLGVFLHGFAADRLQRTLGDAGMLATDLLSEIPAARYELLKYKE